MYLFIFIDYLIRKKMCFVVHSRHELNISQGGKKSTCLNLKYLNLKDLGKHHHMCWKVILTFYLYIFLFSPIMVSPVFLSNLFLILVKDRKSYKIFWHIYPLVLDNLPFIRINTGDLCHSSIIKSGLIIHKLT